MEVAEKVLYVVHMLGLLAILSGWVLAWRSADLRLLVWGARVQLFVGLILVAVASAADDAPPNLWVALKLLVALGVVGCAEVAAQKKARSEAYAPLIHAAGALTLANVAIAFLVGH